MCKTAQTAHVLPHSLAATGEDIKLSSAVRTSVEHMSQTHNLAKGHLELCIFAPRSWHCPPEPRRFLPGLQVKDMCWKGCTCMPTRRRGKGQPEDGDKGNQRTGTRATRGRGQGQPEDGDKGNQRTGKRATRGRGQGQPEDGEKGNQRTGKRATRGWEQGQPEDGEKGNQRTGTRATRGRGKGQPEDGEKGNQRTGKRATRGRGKGQPEGGATREQGQNIDADKKTNHTAGNPPPPGLFCHSNFLLW